MEQFISKLPSYGYDDVGKDYEPTPVIGSSGTTQLEKKEGGLTVVHHYYHGNGQSSYGNLQDGRGLSHNSDTALAADKRGSLAHRRSFHQP